MLLWLDVSLSNQKLYSYNKFPRVFFFKRLTFAQLSCIVVSYSYFQATEVVNKCTLNKSNKGGGTHADGSDIQI